MHPTGFEKSRLAAAPAANFTAVSEGNGGTDIIDPPSGHALLANYTASSFTTAGDRHGGPLVSEPQQNLAAG